MRRESAGKYAGSRAGRPPGVPFRLAALPEAERNALYKQAQEKLARDAVNGFLFILPKITVANAALEGMWTDWPLPVTPLAELRWR